MTGVCGTCGDPTIHIRAEAVMSNGQRLDVAVWVIRCGNGHVWIPIPGQEYELRMDEEVK